MHFLRIVCCINQDFRSSLNYKMIFSIVLVYDILQQYGYLINKNINLRSLN